MFNSWIGLSNGRISPFPLRTKRFRISGVISFSLSWNVFYVSHTVTTPTIRYRSSTACSVLETKVQYSIPRSVSVHFRQKRKQGLMSYSVFDKFDSMIVSWGMQCVVLQLQMEYSLQYFRFVLSIIYSSVKHSKRTERAQYTAVEKG